jgi:hypothetical protein
MHGLTQAEICEQIGVPVRTSGAGARKTHASSRQSA